MSRIRGTPSCCSTGEPAQLHLGDRQFLQRLQRYEEMAPTLRDHPPQEYYLLNVGDATSPTVTLYVK